MHQRIITLAFPGNIVPMATFAGVHRTPLLLCCFRLNFPCPALYRSSTLSSVWSMALFSEAYFCPGLYGITQQDAELCHFFVSLRGSEVGVFPGKLGVF